MNGTHYKINLLKKKNEFMTSGKKLIAIKAIFGNKDFSETAI
jgi:hypothetical protein